MASVAIADDVDEIAAEADKGDVLALHVELDGSGSEAELNARVAAGLGLDAGRVGERGGDEESSNEGGGTGNFEPKVFHGNSSIEAGTD